MNREFGILRWLTFIALLAVAVVYLLPLAQSNRTELPAAIVMVLVAAGMLTWAIESWLRLIINRAAPEIVPGELHPETRTMLTLGRDLIAAQNPPEIIQTIMKSGCEISGAQGCSFVPYDEWGQSFPALVYGKVPSDAMQTWVETLSSPATRQVCKSCQTMGAEKDCVLLKVENSTTLDAVRCLSLTRENRQVGVLNYYFKSPVDLSAHQQTLMREIISMADTALQAADWRDRSISSMRLMQATDLRKQDIKALLDALTANLREAMDVDFSLLWLPDVLPDISPTPILNTRKQNSANPEGEWPERSFLEGILKSVSASRSVLTLENVSLNAKDIWRMLLVVPLSWSDNRVIGLLLLGSKSPVIFNERQLLLIQMVAGEAALLIQSSDQMAKIEFQAVVDERARLAREIHDGLAQTLAFLKMQSSQMQTYLEQGDLSRLTEALRNSGRTLSDAYLDARQAIDHLRRVPGADLVGWLCQVADDFESAADLRVDTSGLNLEGEFSPRVQAQLVRIVQEALSNVRKHAQARNISVSGRVLEEGDLILEVRDDGCGFSPEHVDSAARFGLRGMRERAEMLGADFQVISRPNEGTVVHVRLPAEKVK